MHAGAALKRTPERTREPLNRVFAMGLAGREAKDDWFMSWILPRISPPFHSHANAVGVVAIRDVASGPGGLQLRFHHRGMETLANRNPGCY
jgi:hypothetical protein